MRRAISGKRSAGTRGGTWEPLHSIAAASTGLLTRPESYGVPLFLIAHEIQNVRKVALCDFVTRPVVGELFGDVRRGLGGRGFAA